MALLALGLVAIALAAIGPGLAPTWKWLGENSSNIASWVQAVGSIAAIAAGFAVARFQLAEANRKEAEKLKAEDRANLFSSSVLLADACENGIRWAEATKKLLNQGMAYWAHYLNGSEHVLAYFKNLDSLRLRDPVDIARLAILRSHCETLNQVFQIAVDRAEKGDKVGPKTSESIKAAVDKFLVTARSYKNIAFEKAKENATPEQEVLIKELIDLHENWNKKFPQGINPSGIAEPQIPPPQVVFQ